MCKFLAEYVFIATQLHDIYMYESKPFRQAVGYLLLAPKRIPSGQTLSDEEWVAMNYYNESERAAMAEAFELLDLRLAEWAVSLDGDEDVLVSSEPAVFAKKIWEFRMKAENGLVKIFKAPLGRYVYRPHPFTCLSEMMKSKPILPKQDVAYLPQFAADNQEGESFEQASLRYQARMCRGVELMVGEALADDQPRRRVGTAGEVAQENEILRRVRLSDGKGLRGFVAQVLREAKWQFADGHVSTAEGRQRCYNRVYALLNPLRRVKSKKS